MTRYALVYRDNGRFVQVDSSSGGYPYAVDRPDEAHTWAVSYDAEHYSNHFPDMFDVVVISYYVEKN